LDAVGVASDAGFILSAQEVAALGGLAPGDGFQRGIVVVEQVDQAFAGVVVVLQPLVEVRLFEYDALVDAGHLIAVLVLSGNDFFVIGLGPTGEGGQ